VSLSSIINVSTCSHRSSVCRSFFLCPISLLARSLSNLLYPLQECIVVPPILHAAMPVAAVTARRVDVLPPL
ncbi:hypothetical protein K525DRAFT_159298, partial [Schizophyllum commune Loenen D]